jgi:23S rRNA (guanosine2251-2'-O)-methyltransferase
VDDTKSPSRRKSRRGGRKRTGRNVPAQGARPQQQGKRQGPPKGATQSSRAVPKGQLPSGFIYGINPVAVALDLQRLKVLFYDKGRPNERLQHLHAQAQLAGVEIRPLQRQGWSRILPAELHQGIAGLLYDAPNSFLEEIVHDVGEDSCIVVLDRVQDPQNLGAVLRACAAAGVDAVVLPKAGGCPVTAAVHRASAGMSLKVRIVEDENLARAIEFLKDHDYWVVGCDAGEGEDATLFEYPHKRVLVFGNEAEGMRRLVRESCDYAVRIPMAEGVESLNISVAAGIVLYLAQADLARAAHEAELESEDGAGNGEDGSTGAAPE